MYGVAKLKQENLVLSIPKRVDRYIDIINGVVYSVSNQLGILYVVSQVKCFANFLQSSSADAIQGCKMCNSCL